MNEEFLTNKKINGFIFLMLKIFLACREFNFLWLLLFCSIHQKQ